MGLGSNFHLKRLRPDCDEDADASEETAQLLLPCSMTAAAGHRAPKRIGELLLVPVRPLLMEGELLDRPPTLALIERDREWLTAWLEAPDALCPELVRAMLARHCVAEKDGWFLRDQVGPH